MKGFIKTWWHCFPRIFKDWDKGGHRMAKVTYKAGKWHSYWCCSCELEELIKKQ